MPSLLEIVNPRNAGIVLRNIRKVGPVTTLRYVFSDLFFDMRYGVETINTVMLDELEIDSPNKAHGRYYEGSNAHLFAQIMAILGVDPATGCFIDFGSGKGKAMLLAAERGFRKVIGVEFSPELAAICRRNIDVFRRRTRTRTEFEVVQADAAQYPIPAEANLLYFNNPFDEVLIGKVIGNILKSLRDCPREIIVVHAHPQGNRAFVDHLRFRLEREWPSGYIFRLGPE